MMRSVHRDKSRSDFVDSRTGRPDDRASAPECSFSTLRALTASVWCAFLAIALPNSAASAQQPQWPCLVGRPTVESAIPNDVQRLDQATFNCFAWQEFIGLNWPAVAARRGIPAPNAGPADFGNPNATVPTVWETYKNDTEVFLDRGVKPKGWDHPPPPSRCAAPARGAWQLWAKSGIHTLSALSAFGDFILDSTSLQGGPWLADQAGHLIYYETKINKDEFDSIVANGFYNADVQNETAATGVNPTGGQHQVKLPAGCNAGSCPDGSARTGAIEIKAAWRKLTDDPLQKSRYLTTRAVLVDQAGACSQATMGLVGLHIIHKTVSQPQFIWATFEHVDNVPPSPSPTFNNPNCRCEAIVPAACGKFPTTFQNCVSGQTRGETCSANVPPPSETCPAYPIQVRRERAISDLVVATNTAAKAMLTASNSKTVFRYYQLIDVLWSEWPQDDYRNPRGQHGPIVPLSMSGATPDPSMLPVANTTMETYVQEITCLTCHVNALVASGKYAPNGQYASDFSLILGHAKSPAQIPGAVPKLHRYLPSGLVTFRH
jgi:hypothetical protein